MKKRWWIAGAASILVVVAVFAAGKGGKPGKGGDEATPFRLGKIQQEDLQISVREVGAVDPVTKVDVKSTVSGKIVGLRVREGAVVKAGEMLAEVEPDVNQAQTLSDVKGSLSQARVSFKNSERDFTQQASLFKEGLISEQAYRAAKTTRDLAEENFKSAEIRYQIVEDRGIPISGNATSQRARVTSPMDGVVIKKGVELGDTITSGVSSFNAGTVVFTVADLKSLIIRVNLNEVDIAKVQVGLPVRVTLDAYPQKTFTGKVRFVAPAAKLAEKIKVFEVEVALDELTEAFRTGMSANVEILGERRAKALSLPLEALHRKDGQTLVYRLKKDLKPEDFKRAKTGLEGRGKFTWLSEHWKEFFEPVVVQAGLATLERVEVISGLSVGDQVCLEDPTRKKVEKDEDM